MAKARDEATGRFLSGPEPEWRTPLVWEKAYPDEAMTARPTPYRINPKLTKLMRKCQHCGQEFDALARTPDNYKMAEQAKYCGHTCAKRAEAKRRREREQQARVDCLRPVEPKSGGDSGGIVCRQTSPNWAKKLTREDVE